MNLQHPRWLIGVLSRPSWTHCGFERRLTQEKATPLQPPADGLGKHRDLAQRGRDRRLAGVKADGIEPLPPGTARLEIDRHQPQPLRDAEAELDQALALPGLGPGLVDLEYL